jgi:hypothetical protein
MAGIATFPALIGQGKVKLEGDAQVLVRLQSLLVQFTPDFEILPVSKPAESVTPTENSFEQPEPADTSGG